MGYKASELVRIAEAEVGYLEKRTNSQLDDKTANAGYNNYTKYSRDLYAAGYYNGNKQGFAWCDCFVDWLFLQLCKGDAKKAQHLICQTGSLGAACGYSAGYYRTAGRFFTTPKVGDQIFFGARGNESHTGIVYKVDSEKVYTIEGNTSSTAGVVANGGGVFKKSYKLNYSRISGYGRPRYDEEDGGDIPVVGEYDQEQFIRDVQAATGSEVDGIAGDETIGNTVTVSRWKNRKHQVVVPIQRWLYALGYKDVGEADGVAGPKFTKALKQFQGDNGCVKDGEATKAKKTWRKMLGME